ncbi:MAG: O-antigen ligase family protein [Candidatus Omnitrophica bacterium]|nr:O-antigen ligase family protein [Candidatus Omnitrophota bacterium]
MDQKNIIARMDCLIRGSFYVLILCLPVSIALVESFSGFAIFFFAIKRVLITCSKGTRGFKALMEVVRPPASFLDRPLGFFIAAVVLSVVFSQHHHLSVVAFVGKTLQGLYVYSAFLEVFTDAGSVDNFIFVWFASALITGSSGLFQYFFGHDFLRNTALVGNRVSSSLRHANDLGAYIVAVCPLLLVLLLHWKAFCMQSDSNIKGFGDKPSWWVGVFLFAACVVLVVCLGLTFSRASWVAFFAAIVLVGLYKRKNIFIVFLIIMGFIMLFTPIMVKTRDVSLIMDDVLVQTQNINQTAKDHGILSKEYIQAILNSAVRQSGKGRSLYWREALGIIDDYPVFGAGLNTYSRVAPAYKVSWGGYPHNSYLQIAAELGLVGLGVFLWMLWTLFRGSFRCINRMPVGYLRCVLIGTLAGLFAYLVQSFFDTTFYSVQLSMLLWIMMALAVAVQKIFRSQAVP